MCQLQSFLGYEMEHIFFQVLIFFPIYSQHFFSNSVEKAGIDLDQFELSVMNGVSKICEEKRGDGGKREG